jgi:hypothetical protein
MWSAAMLLGLYRMIAPSYQLMRETAYNNLSGLSILSDQSLGGAWADTTWVWLFQFLNEPYRLLRPRALSKARASPLNSWNLKAVRHRTARLCENGLANEAVSKKEQ